ncbi:MAG: hypothetical protein DHS20C05_14520 [Hyphococcus sp.]|nr:MAG: hypothetical protein DHS20C05_14520 [Marinicaulis sp.]
MADVSSYPLTEKAAPSRLYASLGIVFILALIELPLLAFFYDPLTINDSDPLWLTIRVVLRTLVAPSIFFMTALAVLLAPKRQTYLAQWKTIYDGDRWSRWLIANGVLFLCLLGATFMLNQHNGARPPWALFTLWSLGVMALYAMLALSVAPVSFIKKMIADERWQILLAVGAAILVASASAMSQQSWSLLSEATFNVSAFWLDLYEQDVVKDPAERVLGANGFRVNIAAACSGYEGIGLVTVFLSIYLWIFRSALRFPNAYLILPIGIIAIWILNSVRIAALISLGAHLSPEVAITGFHSQAGWMMFLIVTIGIMLATHQLRFFHTGATASTEPASPAFTEALRLLAPFLAMTAAGIVAAAFTAEGFWLYALRVIAISIALLAGWRFYINLGWRLQAEPLLLGALVGVIWIATDPGRGETSELGDWLTTLTPMAMVLWISMRLFGTIILVPIAEELAFRGYLHRKLIADKFETVAEGAFSWKALIISSGLFAVLHDRWLSGALAGVVFAIALYRSGKVTGAIMAHMSANAVIAFWAVAVGQWSLL